MKKNITLIVTLFFTLGCYTTNVFYQEIDTHKIIMAYDYVKQKYDNKIVVADTIVNLSITGFSFDISKRKKVKHSIIYDSLKQKYERYKQFEYPLKKILKNKSQDGNNRIYFSKPTKEFVIVEVFDTRKRKETAYNVEVFFGESELYLLCFEDDKIVEEYKSILTYN